jgi:hypothetical protein
MRSIDDDARHLLGRQRLAQLARQLEEPDELRPRHARTCVAGSVGGGHGLSHA